MKWNVTEVFTELTGQETYPVYSPGCGYLLTRNLCDSAPKLHGHLKDTVPDLATHKFTIHHHPSPSITIHHYPMLSHVLFSSNCASVSSYFLGFVLLSPNSIGFSLQPTR